MLFYFSPTSILLESNIAEEENNNNFSPSLLSGACVCFCFVFCRLARCLAIKGLPQGNLNVHKIERQVQ